jgi:hypothetical protein
MSLGAYSIVRYANDLNDQRVNLGVVVWHPREGFAHRFTYALDRIQAVNPRAHLRPVREQLNIIKEELDRPVKRERNSLETLAGLFTEGIQVTTPYPARIYSAYDALERLFSMLVSPFPEIRRASSQRQFEAAFGKALRQIVESFPIGRIEEIGTVQIDGVPTTIGFRTITQRKKTLWRPLSLHALDTPEKQLTEAKAAALDVFTTRRMPEYRADAHVVALQQPKTQSSERLEEVVACLKKATDTVLIGADSESFGEQVPALLA